LIDFTLGNCHMTAGRHALAEAAYLKAVKKNDGHAPAWFNLAKSRMELDQLEPAGDAFLSAYDRYDAKRPDILYFAASVYLGAGRNEKAFSAFNRLVSRHPEDIDLAWRPVQVQILLALDKSTEALPVIEMLAGQMKGEKKKEWQEFLLYHYLSLGMEARAFAYAGELTRDDPLEIRWWKALAHIALNREQHKEALAALIVYGHLTPLSMEEKKLMADLFLMVDIPARAVLLLEDLIGQNPDPVLVEKIVYAYEARHQPEKALRWVAQGLRSNPEDLRLLMLKGEVLFRAKSYDQAVETFETLVKRQDREGKAWLMMGYAAWHAKDLPKAVSAMKEAAKFPQQKKAAGEALSALLRMQEEN
jgi:tetratricopeptide (TPR) repeat protein